MTRYEAIQALVQNWRSLGNSNTYTEFHSGQASSWLRCADELEAALALPEDSKVVNAELYGLAVSLADMNAALSISNLCKHSIGGWRQLKACADEYADRVTKSLRYLSLREASGEPMPYRVVRDGDKVRFDVPAPPKDGE